jgi:hypothetical protein
MLSEQTGHKIDLLSDGTMKVHRMTYISKDGVQVAEVYGEYSDYKPGQFDDPKAAVPDATIKVIAEAIWTPKIKAFYAEKLAVKP